MKKTKMSKKVSEDTFLKLTALQVIIISLVIGLIVIAGRIDGKIFSEIKSEFEGYMSNEISFEKYLSPEKEVAEQDTGPDDGEAVTLGNVTEKTEISAITVSGNSVSGLVSGTAYNIDDTAFLPVNGKISSPYGERIHPINGNESFHSGMDIAAPEGSNIYAVLDGTVIAVGVGESSGNYVKLKHDGNIETFYGHCSRVYVTKGMNIRKGDVIASVGHTGAATGPHVHFELHIDGELLDPEAFISKAVSSDGN